MPSRPSTPNVSWPRPASSSGGGCPPPRDWTRSPATRRLAGLLARKGYSGGLAMRVVREALADSDED